MATAESDICYSCRRKTEYIKIIFIMFKYVKKKIFKQNSFLCIVKMLLFFICGIEIQINHKVLLTKQYPIAIVSFEMWDKFYLWKYTGTFFSSFYSNYFFYFISCKSQFDSQAIDINIKLQGFHEVFLRLKHGMQRYYISWNIEDKYLHLFAFFCNI